MKIYADFFYNFSKEVLTEFNEFFGATKEMPDKWYKPDYSKYYIGD